MFERFTDQARSAVLGAQAEASGRGAPTVRSEHLLAALLSAPDGVAPAALLRAGVDPLALLRTVRALDDPAPTGRPSPQDGQALAALGIDLDEVRRQVEQSFGPGALERTRAAQGGSPSRHLRLDPSAKKVLELSLREALHLRHRAIGAEHLLLAMLHPATGAASEVLAAAGVRLDDARRSVDELLRERAAG